MDKKKSTATGSSSDGKKDENFLMKTAHSIRDKVHGLTDEVKEKTHNLTHSSDSKKSKKDKDHKPTDTKLKTSSKPTTATKKDSDSDDEDDSPKSSSRSAISSGPKTDNKQDAKKPDRSGAKPSTSEKKDAAPPTRSKSPSDKPTSRNSGTKLSDDHKDSTAAPSSSAKPSNPPSNDKQNDGGDTTNQSSSQQNNKDQIHISFDGVVTVADLLDRIDDAVEKTKIIVEGDNDKTDFNLAKKLPTPTPSTADLDKIPVNENKEDDNKEENQKDEDEPIIINYNEIHKIEDLLVKVNRQPGKRKVVLQNAPDNSDSITVQKKMTPSSTAPPTSTISNENDLPPSSATTNEHDDPSAPPKSILKTSQDPSSLDTSTKTSSFEDDKIHVNIEGVHDLDELLDRLDDAVQNVPVIIDTKHEGEKRQAPQAPNQNEAAKTSLLSQKREAPKAPSITTDQSTNDKPSQTTSEKKDNTDDKVPSFKIPEHEFDTNKINKQASSSSTSDEEKKDDASGPSDWI